MDLRRDIQSLTDFKKNTPEFIRRMKDTGEPVVLTINGKAELVVQDAASYQKLLDIADQARIFEAIRSGLEDVKAGRTQPLDEAFAEIRRDLDRPQALMIYQIELTTTAKADIREATRWLRDLASAAVAEKWLSGLYKKIGSLQTRPRRCPIAAESHRVPRRTPRTSPRAASGRQAPDRLHHQRSDRLDPLRQVHIA